MAYNAAWTRWIVSSFIQWFQNNYNTTAIYLEGMPRKTDTLESFVELRFNGPSFKQITAANWDMLFSVDILIQHAINADYYAQDKVIGAVIAALPNAIPILQLQDTSPPGTLLDCMKLSPKGHSTHRYGQARDRTQLVQASVEVAYTAVLT